MLDARFQTEPASGVAPDVGADRAAFPSTEGMGTLADLLDEHDGSPRGGGVVCPCCRGVAKRVVRARPGGARQWVAVCAICAGRLLAGHPGTIIGGRVRPRLRRVG